MLHSTIHLGYIINFLSQPQYRYRCQYLFLYYCQGLLPIAVATTAGTTVLGAFDPLNEIADVSEKHSWIHMMRADPIILCSQQLQCLDYYQYCVLM